MLRAFIYTLICFPFLVNAQILKPVKWSTETKSLGNNEFDLIAKAKIEDGWHLYSKTHEDGGVGIPASFEISEDPDIELIGEVKEVGDLHEAYSELFEQDEKFYEKSVAYHQKIKANKKTKVTVEVGWQVCDDSRCLPPDFKELTFALEPKTEKQTTTKPEKEEPKQTEPKDSVQEEIKTIEEVSTANNSDSILVDSSQQVATPVSNLIEPIKENATAKSCEEGGQDLFSVTDKKNKSYWVIFVLGFLGGLAALLMPCIFPMIPITVSLFTKQSKSKAEGIKKAIIYGLSIIIIYVALGLIITAIFGSSALNEFATNPYVNIAFFVVFVVFALSFFGAFELTLPSKWVNFADKGADKGGLIGIFFMAFTLALVSFSCTGPIIGTLLVTAVEEGGFFSLAIGMFGFSAALAIPFTLFAMFPGWLNSLPKSGGWLNAVKVSLGFIELAFAFKFLSNADLVWQAHWLQREVFIAIWIAIFGAMTIYLFGKFRMKLDTPVDAIGVNRLLFALLTLSFVIYLIPGLWGAPLKLLSGLTPPKNYAESPYGFNDNNTQQLANEHMEFGPHKIPAFKDFEHAAAYAEQVNKPLLLDFTGFACANCRKVEDLVWSDPTIKQILTEKVILVSLYVDERKKLPEDQQIFNETLERKLRTVGDKWTAFEIEHFKANAQPYYRIVDPCLNRYSDYLEAEYDIKAYTKWLEVGIKNYYEHHPK